MTDYQQLMTVDTNWARAPFSGLARTPGQANFVSCPSSDLFSWGEKWVKLTCFWVCGCTSTSKDQDPVNSVIGKMEMCFERNHRARSHVFMWNLIRMLHQSQGLNKFRHFTPRGGCQVLHLTAPHCWMRSLHSLEILRDSIYVSVCVCVCVCVLGAKGFRSIIKHTPSLNYCFHGEVESALKKRLYPVIKDFGGREGGQCPTWQWCDDDDGPSSPCSSFPWQWGEWVFGERGVESGWRVIDAHEILIFLTSISICNSVTCTLLCQPLK